MRQHLFSLLQRRLAHSGFMIDSQINDIIVKSVGDSFPPFRTQGEATHIVWHDRSKWYLWDQSSVII